MTTYTWNPTSLAQTVNWDTPTDWLPEATPNAIDADVIIPEITSNGGAYIFDITIGSTTHNVQSLSITDNDLQIDGDLIDSGPLTLGQDSALTMSSGSLTVGTMTIAGGSFLLGSGLITSAGSIDNEGEIAGSQMTLDVAGLLNMGTMFASDGFLEVDGFLATPTSFNETTITNLSNYSAGTLSLGTYQAVPGATLDLNVGGAIVTDAADIVLGGPESQAASVVEASGASIAQSLQTIASSGTLSLQNLSFAAANTLVDDGIVRLTGGTFASPGLTIGADGSFTGFGTITGPVTDDGNLAITNASTLTLGGSLDGTGTVTINPGAAVLGVSRTALEIAATSTSAPQVVFADWNGILTIDNPTQFDSAISGFSVGVNEEGITNRSFVANSDSIILNGINFSAITNIEYNGDTSGGTLTLQEAGGTIALNFLGDYTISNFIVTIGPQALSTLPPSVLITEGPAPVECLAAGTLIETRTGPVAVENLRVGDYLNNPLSATYEPIVWIGSRMVNCFTHPAPETVWPVRVRAEAIAENVPLSDLWLSPDHAVFVDGLLIPARLLTNGVTIEQVATNAVTYYHIELPRHGVIVAAGLSVESWLDTGGRSKFVGGDQPFVSRLNFAAGTWEMMACAPLIVTGPKLASVRHHLNARAAGIVNRRTPEPRAA